MPVKHPNPKLAQEDHYYKTPPICTLALLGREKFIGSVWEPACGDGAMASVIESFGYNVVATELMDRGYGETGRDFLKEDKLLAFNIVTNPPFKLADEFVHHAFELGANTVCILQRLAWLEGRKRYETLYSLSLLEKVYVFSGRQTLWRGDDANAKATGGAVPFAWFVFKRDHYGKPEIDWILT